MTVPNLPTKKRWVGKLETVDQIGVRFAHQDKIARLCCKSSQLQRNIRISTLLAKELDNKDKTETCISGQMHRPGYRDTLKFTKIAT